MKGPQREFVRRSIEDLEKVVLNHNGKPLSIALDTETTGLIPFEDKITWISWAISESEFGAFPIRHRAPPTDSKVLANAKILIQNLHRDSQNTIIWHNASFDLTMLIGDGWLELDDIQAKIIDTMLASYVLNPVKKNEGGSHALKSLYEEYLRKGQSSWPYQPEFEEVSGDLDFRDAPIEEAAWYAAFDAWSTLQLWQYFEKEFEIKENESVRHYYYKVELPHLLTTVEIRASGMALLDQDSAQGHADRKSITQWKEEYEKIKTKVFDLVKWTFNFESPDSMRKALFFGPPKIRPLGRGEKSGKYVLDKRTLADLLCREPLGNNSRILAYTIYGKQIAASISKHEEVYGNVNRSTRRIHPNIAPTTTSGRYWANSPNTLSLSTSSEIKHHIIPKDSDNTFVIADFSQIDLRVIANETGLVNSESKMLADVNSGVDLHLNTLKIVDSRVGKSWMKIKKDPITKEPIQIKHLDGTIETCSEDLKKTLQLILKARSNIAKPINFGVSYGLGADKLMQNLNETEEFRDEILKLPKSAMEQDQNLDVAVDVIKSLAWLSKIQSQLKIEPRSLEEVEGYLQEFHQTYPDIRKFQLQIEDEMRSRGYSDNIFGRRCRAELLTHLGHTEIDIRCSGNRWFRLHVEKIEYTKKHLDCLLYKVVELVVTEPKKKRFPEISDLNFEPGRTVYEVNTGQLNKIFSDFQVTGDLDRLIDDILILHEQSTWDVDDLFESILLPVVPQYKGRNLSSQTDRQLYPFCRINDALIRRIRIGKEETFIPYYGYDTLRRKLISQRVSSTSMDFCKIAMIEVRKRFRQDWPTPDNRPYIINCIHDEIAVECQLDDAVRVRQILEEVMQASATYKGYLYKPDTLLVTMEAETKIGQNYADAKP